MIKHFLSTIEYGEMTINTNVDGPNIAFGETLSGTVYIDGDGSDELIDYIMIELLKRSETNQVIIAKQSIEIMSAVKSKETWMMPFEMVPDERWESETEAQTQTLILKTTVHLKNGIDIQDEDEITYA
ncbi:stage 0 sporulation protein M [Sporosarcina sp. ANT_H38]|uniref:sporulation protein n=1 Tax=Sporosarcina sp. ANT_H38 TaxID=2597358 RepID=UPI0011F0A9CF|nr:sporulation protein [Sporosarcina sp. ANT_H38]KAA0965780.1 stage 0 sporulation protein M [Sporosarcina sp. ANT_H38]